MDKLTAKRAVTCQTARFWKCLAYSLISISVISLFPITGYAETCEAESAERLVPADPTLCSKLHESVAAPSEFSLDAYQSILDRYLGHFCHRDLGSGWERDKYLRDTGPFTADLQGGEWQGKDYGTHAPVVIWYSPEMADWLTEYRSNGETTAEEAPSVPDGAVMVKEMYPAPTSRCSDVDPLKLYPTNGAAIMIRDNDASHDGWYWGWYGFGQSSGWAPDWPPAPTNPMPNQGFAQYCMNCHASAEDNLTFASPRNIQGEPGTPLTFLSQDFFQAPAPPARHRQVALPDDDVHRLGTPHYKSDRELLEELRALSDELPDWDSISKMPSQTYDNTWVGAGGPDASDEFLTSSQCLGCHNAGSTGLQFDMTESNPHGDDLFNLSPYATWRSSPMGLAGRDPFFFAHLASETQSFHPEDPGMVEDTCLGCHGVTGQRQFQIDQYTETESCPDFRRETVNAVPWPDDHPGMENAKYGMLARDGISCTACHRMALGEETEGALSQPENACVEQRQVRLNPDNSGFAKTFTGSFPVRPPDSLIGPFQDPKVKPMENALGITPEHNADIASSEVCGSCHTVHLPVLQKGEVIDYTYEQTTYPEWAFSAYRTGDTPDGPLPHGKGERAESCQSCHMPSEDSDGTPYRSKIASIQEHSNFPEAEHRLEPDDIDLDVRDNYSRHTLVGLNVFLIKMAQQFPDILGIRTVDPMLVGMGVDPLLRTEQAMLDLASNDTAEIAVEKVESGADTLSATISLTNKVGHKFPSGVGFRRAFVDFRVLDAQGNTLWASGRTNRAGVLVDQSGEPIEGEYWWSKNCSARIEPEKRLHQPHYETVSRQDRAQIYQELVSTPPDDASAASCGKDSEPAGQLTTSFLSICSTVKDNRLLPHGFLPDAQRSDIAEALGAGDDLAEDIAPTAIGDDPDYNQGGGDSLVYEVPLADLPKDAKPAAVKATLYYQATPPFYLQDRMCTAKGEDRDRLGFLAGHLNLDETQAENWKLEVVSSGAVPLAK